MTTKKLILTLCLCLCLCRASPIKVKLSDVKAITLTAGQPQEDVLHPYCSSNAGDTYVIMRPLPFNARIQVRTDWMPNGIVKRISQNGYPLKTQMLIVKVMTTPPTLIFWQAAAECPILSKVLPLTNRVHSQQGNRPQV